MEFDLDKARELFEIGHFASISRAAGSSSAHLQRLQPAARSLLAHTFVYTGRLTLAADLVRSLAGSDIPLSCRSESHIVVGLIRKREGRIDEACAEFQFATRLAKDARDKKWLAWAQAHLFRVLADGQFEQELTALLADVRRSVSGAADPHVAAFLHDSVAAMEARKGRTTEASRHLRVARSLLILRPNAWLEQLLEINASCVALIDCDQDQFKTHSAHARRLASLTGHSNSDAVMDTNDAHSVLVRGDIGKASSLLQRILQSPGDVYVELAALEGLARMHMALGQFDDCERVLGRIDMTGSSRLQLAYTARGAAALRVKLLIRRGQWANASELAKSELHEFSKVNDVASSVALMTQRALALVCSGDLTTCSRELLDTGLIGGAALHEQQAEYFHTCGMALDKIGRTDVAPIFKERAIRIWAEQGNEYGPMDAVAGERTLFASKAAEGVPTAGSRADQLWAAEARAGLAVNHVASAFDLAYNPTLLGDELLHTIREYDLSPSAEILRNQPLAKPIAFGNNGRAIHLGEVRGSPLTLVCEVPADPYKAILLSDILRLGRAAVALERAREEERNRAALWPADPIETQEGAIFLAEQMQHILSIARRIAPTSVPVLITGETGTGKEVLARTIHAYSSRAHATFLPFNCTSTPKDMLDSQLFGHRRGAFTGAVDNFQGVVRAAAGGTLFLDEIGDTSLEIQPKLLRFVESNEIHPIGETHPTPVDVRLIVATNADLDTLVGQGRFREDLFYRLSIVRLHLPPLRERRVEIPTLASHYLQKYAQEYGKGDLRLSEDTTEYLLLYKWPGNVRQLANEMRRLAVMAEAGAVLMPEHLHPDIASSRRTIPASERVLDPTEVVVRLDQPMPAAVQHLEQTMLQYALNKCGGRMEETAAMLGLSRKGLYLKRQRLGIEPPQASDAVAR